MDYRRSVIAALAIVFVGCGDQTSVKSGLDRQTKIADLSSSEAETFCRAVNTTNEDFFHEHRNGSCKLGVAFAAALGEDVDCEAQVLRCEADASDFSDSDCDPSNILASTCELTIGEIESCYNTALEAQAVVLEELSMLSCAELLDPNTAISSPASCAACPDLGLDILRGSEVGSE